MKSNQSSLNSEALPAELIMTIFHFYLQARPDKDEIQNRKIHQQKISTMLILNKSWRNYFIKKFKNDPNYNKRFDIMLLKILYDAILCQEENKIDQILDSGFNCWSRESWASLDISLFPDYRSSKVEHDQVIIDKFLKKLKPKYELLLHSASSKVKYEKFDKTAFEDNSPNLSILVAKTVNSIDHHFEIVVRFEQLQFLPEREVDSSKPVSHLFIKIDEVEWEDIALHGADEELQEVYKFHQKVFANARKFAPNMNSITLQRTNGFLDEDFFTDIILQSCHEEIIKDSSIASLQIITYKESWIQIETELELIRDVYANWIDNNVGHSENLKQLSLEFYPKCGNAKVVEAELHEYKSRVNQIDFKVSLCEPIFGEEEELDRIDEL